MTLNKDQANHANEQLCSEATQEEIRAILSQDGPLVRPDCQAAREVPA